MKKPFLKNNAARSSASPVKRALKLLIPGILLPFITACHSNSPLLADNGGIVLETEEKNSPETEITVDIALPPETETMPISTFDEIWAYLVSGREQAFQRDYPLSDVVYAGAEVDTYGHLSDAPNPAKLAHVSGRLHLMAACNNRALTHFVLEEGSSVRERLIADLLEASKGYDGLQIDFEYVPARDGDNFRSFLKELRAGLKNKTFTVALPARTETLNNDVYDYGEIQNLADKILVMAYDEHWSTSEPGPIASMNWCKSVAAYSLAVIGPDKLIMGLPFYGRAWGNINPSRAYLFSGIEELKKEKGVTEIRRERGIPTFDYDTPVSVKVYYEDAYSLSTRLEMYRAMGVKSVGFWRLGQETPAVWGLLRLGKR
jgi:spore germination protein YaaH